MRDDGTFQGHNYDPRHFRFERTVTQTPVIETYNPPDWRWAVAVPVAVLALLALVMIG
jgi:hypothetical protein